MFSHYRWLPRSRKYPISALLPTICFHRRRFFVPEIDTTEPQNPGRDPNETIVALSTFSPRVNPIPKLLEQTSPLCAAILERAERYDREVASKQMSLYSRRYFMELVSLLHQRMSLALSTQIPGARLDICGSCSSDLFTRESDVDLSIHIPQLERNISKKNERDRAKRIIVNLRDTLQRDFSKEFERLIAVRYARLPVLKGNFFTTMHNRKRQLTISFDVCLSNDMAVANSKLLRQYAMIDRKTKSLILAVLTWAKENNISEASLGWWSSYAWTNMAIFYLQHLGLLPNLQCPKLIKLVGIQPNDASYIVDGLSTAFVPWDVLQSLGVWESNTDWNQMPLSIILHGFFHFYAHEFPRDHFAVSIRVGTVSLLKSTCASAKPLFYCIEDPFRVFDSPEAHDLSRPVSHIQHQEQTIQALMHGEAYFRRLLLPNDDEMDSCAIAST